MEGDGAGGVSAVLGYTLELWRLVLLNVGMQKSSPLERYGYPLKLIVLKYTHVRYIGLVRVSCSFSL